MLTRGVQRSEYFSSEQFKEFITDDAVKAAIFTPESVKEFFWPVCCLIAHRNYSHGFHFMFALENILGLMHFFSKSPKTILYTVQDTCLWTKQLPDTGLGDLSDALQHKQKNKNKNLTPFL